MALKSIQNYDYRGTQPNFVRDSFDTMAAMLAWPVSDIDEGHLSYCKETRKTYRFTGATWEEFNQGGGGGGGTGDKTDVITVAASNPWVINHSLNKYPSVTTIDSNGYQVFGDVEYISMSQVKVHFGASFSGKAILN